MAGCPAAPAGSPRVPGDLTGPRLLPLPLAAARDDRAGTGTHIVPVKGRSARARMGRRQGGRTLRNQDDPGILALTASRGRDTPQAQGLSA